MTVQSISGYTYEKQKSTIPHYHRPLKLTGLDFPTLHAFIGHLTCRQNYQKSGQNSHLKGFMQTSLEIKTTAGGTCSIPGQGTTSPASPAMRLK